MRMAFSKQNLAKNPTASGKWVRMSQANDNANNSDDDDAGCHFRVLELWRRALELYKTVHQGRRPKDVRQATSDRYVYSYCNYKMAHCYGAPNENGAAVIFGA